MNNIQQKETLLPPPELLERYEGISKGLSKDLVDLIKKEQEHRHALQDKYLMHFRIGQIFGAIFLIYIISMVFETAKNGKLVAIKAVNGDEDLMVVTTNGIVIRTPISQIKISGRNTQGVKIIRIEDKQRVSSITIVPHEDIEEDNEEVVENIETTTEDKPNE